MTQSLESSGGGSFPSPGDGGTLDRVWLGACRAVAAADPAGPPLLGASCRGAAQAITFGDLAAHLPAPGDGFPATDTGSELRLAGQLLAADHGIRVIHVPLSGDFDTHTSVVDRYPQLMDELDGAVDAFLTDLERRGLADRVLVATTSEFGRRADDNGSGGLDHGTAACALLLGPVAPGVHGELSRLDRLDPDGNLVATTNLTEYYATLTESWMAVPANDGLPDHPTPLSGVVRTHTVA